MTIEMKSYFLSLLSFDVLKIATLLLSLIFHHVYAMNERSYVTTLMADNEICQIALM